MIIAATGHRPNKIGNEYNYSGPISTYVFSETKKYLSKWNPILGISGLALGYDQIFALCCLELNIPLLAAIPCDGQTRFWKENSKNLYNEILSNPLTTSEIVCPGPYAKWKMQRRNEFMVNKADKILALFDGSPGGTANTVKYAFSKKKEVIIIDPNDRVKKPIQKELF